MTRAAIPVIAVLLLAGCIAKNPYRAVYYYSIDRYIPEDIKTREEKLDLGLAVMEMRAPSRYGVKMLYRLPDGIIGFREYDRWVESPSELVTQAMIRAFCASGAFKHVGGTSSLRWAEYSLAGNIVKFSEIRDNGVRTAEFSIRLELNRIEGGDVVWSGILSARREMAAEDGTAFAAALGQAVGEVLTGTVDIVTGAVEKDLKKRQAEETEEPDGVTTP